MSDDDGAPRGRLTRVEWAFLAVALVAFLWRLEYARQPQVVWDSAWYLMLARSFAEDGTFWIRWTDPPAYSGYWPPLYPIFLAPVVRALGASYHSLVAGAALASLLLAVAVFLTTWDLLGRTRAFAAMALVAASPAFLASDQRGMGESLLALFVVLTLWAFLKSLDRPLWLLPALAFAALAYLAKANLGLPFVALALGAVVGWRVWRRGPAATARSPIDLAVGGLGVVALAVAALTRSGRLGGAGVALIEPVRVAVADPWWGAYVAFKLVFAAAFLLVVALPFSLWVRPALREWRDERAGALWLAVVLPLVATAVFTASFLVTERRPLVDFDNVRYLTPSLVPFLWLVLPHVPFERDPVPREGIEGERVRRDHRTVFALAAGLYVALLLFNPNAGVQSLPRLVAFLALATVPVGLALVARSRRYEVVERTLARGVISRRYQTRTATVPWRVVLPAFAVVAVLAWYVSAWYLAAALGLVVALSASSVRGAAITMALVLLAAGAPYAQSGFPAEEAARALDERLPPGALVGLTDPPVYVAAVAPTDVRLREVTLDALPSDLDALVVTGSAGARDVPGFVAVASWDYSTEFSPFLAARLVVERDVLGLPFATGDVRALTLFLPNGTQA